MPLFGKIVRKAKSDHGHDADTIGGCVRAKSQSMNQKVR
jgi:hypothetical protein